MCVILCKFYSSNFKYILLLLASALSWTCSSREGENTAQSKIQKNSFVASVGQSKLQREELAQLIPVGTAKQDSTLIAKRFIKQWVQNELLLEKAKKADLNRSNIDKKVETYRNSLLLDYFEQDYLKQKLDTVVSDKEIRTYYKKNQSVFRLNSPIVKASFIKIQSNSKFKNKIFTLLKAANAWEKGELKAYCDKFAHQAHLDDSTWTSFDKLVFDSPFQDKKKAILKPKRFFRQSSGEFEYFLKIKQVKEKGKNAPLVLVKARVRDNILNERKVKLKAKLREDTYREGLKNKRFTVELE